MKKLYNEKKRFRLRSKHLFGILVSLCVMMIAVSFLTDVSPGGLRSLPGKIMVPLQNGLDRFVAALEHNGVDFRSKKTLVDENTQLKKQVVELQQANQSLTSNQQELHRLQELYKIDQSLPDYPKTGARIIAKNTGNWFTTFVINKGSADGIAVDCNVVAQGGLVGIVTEVSDHWSTVRAIIDDVSSVSAMVQKSSDLCLVSGDLKAMQNKHILLTQLKDAEGRVKVGDQVVTSDVSSKFLPGLVIGYIDSLSKDSNNLTKSGTIVPTVDFEHLREVLVITKVKEVPAP